DPFPGNQDRALFGATINCQNRQGWPSCAKRIGGHPRTRVPMGLDMLGAIASANSASLRQHARCAATEAESFSTRGKVAQWNLGAIVRERGRTKKELANNGS
ncbi:MAG TPA: hypothetical protein VES92_09110, partial [Nitrospiraceae bacterium]|nr:hypothetical protein [Nitrospiraceae bacterium]